MDICIPNPSHDPKITNAVLKALGIADDDDDTPSTRTTEETAPAPEIKTYVCVNCSRVCVTTSYTADAIPPRGCAYNRMFKWQEVKKIK